LDVAALRKLVLEASRRDDVLREKLLMAATVAESKGLSALRKVVKQATRTNGFVEYREAGGYASRLEDLAELLSQRIEDGQAELIEVIEEAIALAEDALQHVDDSGGEVMPAILGLRKVHLAACNALRPDPVALARRLYGFQMHGEWDTFHEVLPDYAEALGVEGLAAYRQQVEREWKALPTLGPEYFRSEWSTSRFRVESAMKDIARHTDDFELLVAVHAKNLSSPSCFLMLARLFRDQGRKDEALRWVEQGITAFPDERNDDLLSLAIELQLALGRHAEVERLAWQRFEKAPGCGPFFKLMKTAGLIDREAALRKRGLDLLWQKVAEEESPDGLARRSPWEKPHRGDIVSIFLHESDTEAEAMWGAFCGGKVDVGLWASVADVRARTHHEEAIALLKRLLPHRVEGGSRGSHYGEAFAIVKKIRALRVTHGQLGMFGDELAEIRLKWKRKRNFMKLLDAL
jgi:tetratricopeptide (TPR) repeat protein